jgi:hypothetical protein
MKRSRLPCLPFSIQLTLDHSKCTSSNVTEHRNIPGVTPGLRTLSAWGYGRSSYRLPHLYTPLPLTKRDATMAVPQADKPRGPTYELTQPRVARFRSRVHVLSGYGLVTVEKHTIDTSTRRRTPPFLGSLTRTPPPPPLPDPQSYSPTPLFFFLRHVVPNCMCPIACPILKPKPRAALHSQRVIPPPEYSLCRYPIQQQRRLSRADVRHTRRAVLPRVAPQGGPSGREPDQQRARLAKRAHGLTAVRVRHTPRRAREQSVPALAPRLRARPPAHRRHPADLEPPKPVRLAPLRRASPPPHACFFRAE